MDERADRMEHDTSFDLNPLEESIHALYSCEECCYSTKDKSNFNKHKKRHKKVESTTSCEQPKKLPVPEILVPETSGSTCKIQLCSECGITFRSKFGLVLHQKNKHEKKFKHTCKICSKVFNQTVQYSYHCNAHHKVTLDKCSYCKTEFTSHGSLKRHLESFHNTKPNIYVCDICQSSFTQKSRLSDHMKGKHQEQRYICHLCGKKFSWRSSLKAHLKHTHPA